MRTIALPIKVLSVTDEKGNMSPMQFKAKAKDETDLLIKIDKIYSKEFEKLAGNVMLLYKCIGLVNDRRREFELKFEINSCKWMLWKM